MGKQFSLETNEMMSSKLHLLFFQDNRLPPPRGAGLSRCRIEARNFLTKSVVSIFEKTDDEKGDTPPNWLSFSMNEVCA